MLHVTLIRKRFGRNQFLNSYFLLYLSIFPMSFQLLTHSKIFFDSDLDVLIISRISLFNVYNLIEFCFFFFNVEVIWIQNISISKNKLWICKLMRYHLSIHHSNWIRIKKSQDISVEMTYLIFHFFYRRFDIWSHDMKYEQAHSFSFRENL